MKDRETEEREPGRQRSDQEQQRRGAASAAGAGRSGVGLRDGELRRESLRP
jgi:hypothetical protein